MKNLIYILFFACLSLSCKNDKHETVVVGVKDTVLVKAEKEIDWDVRKIAVAQIPKDIPYKGVFKEGYFYQDASGTNVVFITETGIYRNKNLPHEFDDSADAELFVYSYAITSKENILNWKIYDFINDCPVDIVARFIENTFTITDLDKNGKAEIWVMYKTVCHSDVSPADVKIIMYEGAQKHALRGESKIQTGIDDNNKPLYHGGTFTMDAAFKNAPEVFKTYAEKLWQANIMEDWK